MTWSAIAWTSATLLTSGGPAAYPIPPVPLRVLVEKADVIATVVVRRGLHVVPPSELGYEIVELDVEQLLKGDPGRTTIRQFNWFMVCPSPARYVPGHRALAFLDRDPEGASAAAPDGFTTHALSYGSKTLDAASLALYVERVKEQLAILVMPEGPERRAAQVEWLVRCAEQPVTRWEGAYDLAPQGDSMSDYDPKRPAPWAAELNLEQRLRLLDALLHADEVGRGEKCLEHLLDADRDPRLLAWLVARLRSTEAPEKEEHSFPTRRVVYQIAGRDPRPEIAAIAKEFGRSAFLPPAERTPEHLAAERRRLVAELLALFPQ